MAQQFVIRGKLLDSASGEPVIAATIAIKGSYMGAISNDQGLFQLSAQKGQVVSISSMGYKSIELPATDFDSALTTIYLDPDSEVLEEVVISREPTEELLKRIIDKSRMRIDKPIMLTTYYREFSKHNDRTIKFSDGIIDYYVRGNRNTIADLIVRQSRAVRITTPPEEFDSASAIHLQKRIAINYDMGFVYDAFIKGNRYVYYNFALSNRKGSDGREFTVIQVTPKPGSGEPLFTGIILFDANNELIYSIDLEYKATPGQRTGEKRLKGYRFALQDQRFSAQYALVNDYYYLLHNTSQGSVSMYDQSGVSEVISARSDLVTLNFAQDAPGYDKKKLFRDRNLYNRGNQYSEPFWQRGGAIIMTPEEEEAVRALSKPDASAKP